MRKKARNQVKKDLIIIQKKIIAMTFTKSKLQSQLQAILAQLEHYKATNNYLQCKIDKQKLVKILQEQRNRTLEIQNQILEKNNEGFRKNVIILR